MKLDQKQFVPFMATVAILTMIVIVYSSFSFKNEQRERFETSLAESDSLTIMSLPRVGANDSVSVSALKGNKVLLVFWASWSEKSQAMLDEMQRLKAEEGDIQVLAALVKDAEESLPESKEYSSFNYVDGTHLYNYLKVPGFPSYIFFDDDGNILRSQIGYEKGVGYDSLKVYAP